MTLSAATRRARGTNPRARREIETKIGYVVNAVELIRAGTGCWPTVSDLAEALAHTNSWSTFTRNRNRLNEWLARGTLARSKLRMRTGEDGVVRIESAADYEDPRAGRD